MHVHQHDGAGERTAHRRDDAHRHDAPGADHDHGHAGHDHVHEHARPAGEGYAARRRPEFVVLDLGEDVGALIVHADPQLHGVEIEISPAGAGERREHKEVLEREAGGRAAFTAVFDNLHAGRYTLWVDGIARAREVEIAGGAIAELDWTGRGRDLAAPAAR